MSGEGRGERLPAKSVQKWARGASGLSTSKGAWTLTRFGGRRECVVPPLAAQEKGHHRGITSFLSRRPPERGVGKRRTTARTGRLL